MAIIRSKRTRNFTVLNNDLIRDTTLSFKARGLLQYMLSMPDDWKFYVSELAKHSSKEGEGAIRSAITELEEAGYMRRIRKRGKGGKFEAVDWEVLDEPAFSPHVKKPHVDKPQVEEPHVANDQLLNTNGLSTNCTKDNRSTNKSVDRVSEKEVESNFDKLWKLYPRKEGKKKAFEAYKRAIKKGVTNKEIQAGIVNYLAQIKAQGTAKQYIKQGSTWFNGECWNDEYNVGQEKSPVNSKTVSSSASAERTVSDLEREERESRRDAFPMQYKNHPEWFTDEDVQNIIEEFPELKEKVLEIERARATSDRNTAK